MRLWVVLLLMVSLHTCATVGAAQQSEALALEEARVKARKDQRISQMNFFQLNDRSLTEEPPANTPCLYIRCAAAGSHAAQRGDCCTATGVS